MIGIWQGPRTKIRSDPPPVDIHFAFKAAHSITPLASACDLAPDALWFPLLATLIAISIVYMALENIVGDSTVHKRWMIAFAFGPVHGFGFSFDRADRLRQFLRAGQL